MRHHLPSFRGHCICDLRRELQIIYFNSESEDLPKSLKTTSSRAFIEEILWHIQRFEAVFGSFRRAVHFAHVPT